MTDERERDAAWADAELERLMADTALVQDPYPLYEWLRAESPVAKCHGLNLVTRYEDVRLLYRDRRLSRHQAAVAESRAHFPEGDAQLEEVRLANVSMLINQDDPDHARIRRILEHAFRPASVVSWRPRIESIANALVDAVADTDEFDLLARLAYPLPEAVICELMGVPLADHVLWKQWIDTVVGSARTHDPTPEHARAVADANLGFFEYFRDLVRSRRRKMGDDLVSVLIRAEDAGDRLNEVELLGTLQMLIAAGHETTANLLGNGMWHLLSHRDQYDALRADPSLVPSAVEEMLRFETPAHWSLPRIATEDVSVGDQVISSGSMLMLVINSANRDSEAFDRPDEFDIHRAENRHLSFAAGPHYCLGAMLARQEAQAMVEAIVTRLAPLELVETPRFRTTFVRALESLKVRRRG